MKCEALDFNDKEWSIGQSSPTGRWNGRCVQLQGADLALQNVYTKAESHRIASTTSVKILPIIADYTPDENLNSPRDNSSSKDDDRGGGYQGGIYYKNENNKKEGGIKGEVYYGDKSKQFYGGGHVAIDEGGKVSGKGEVGVRGRF